MLFILLRVLHILSGIIWTGGIVFLAVFLEPTVRTIGPDAGKVMAEMGRRKFSLYMLAAGLVTVLAGIGLLVMDRMQFGSSWMQTRSATAYQFGAAMAIIAIIIGGSFTRPAVEKLMAPGGAQRPDAPALRARLKTGGRVVAALLTIAAASMAVARYL